MSKYPIELVRDRMARESVERIERDILYGENPATMGNGQNPEVTMESLREAMEEARRRGIVNSAEFMGQSSSQTSQNIRAAQLEGFRLRIEHLLNSDHTPFIRGILTSPQEPFPKEIYGDWLEEQGDEDCEGWRWMAKNGKYPLLKFTRPDTTYYEIYYAWRGPNSAPAARAKFPWLVLPLALYPKLWSQSLMGNGNRAYHHFSTQDQNCLHAYLDLLQAYRAAPKVRVADPPSAFLGDGPSYTQCCTCKAGECCKANPENLIEQRDGVSLLISEFGDVNSAGIVVAQPRKACTRKSLEDQGFLCLDD